MSVRAFSFRKLMPRLTVGQRVRGKIRRASMRSMFIIFTCWVNIPSNTENVFSVNNNKKQSHKSRENIFLPCCFIAQDTKSNFCIQRKRWPVPRQSLAMLRLLQQINDWAFCRQEWKKKGFLKWGHDHETEWGSLRRMETRCEPGGNTPGSHNTTV